MSIDSSDSAKKKPFKQGHAEPTPTLKTRDDAEVQARLARLESEISAPLTSSLNSPINSPVSAPLPFVSEGGGVQVKKADHSVHINMAVFWVIAIMSILLVNVPGINFLLTPVNQFVVLIHEASHAIAAVLTGGHPAMTIVPDGQNHGGITQTNGGWMFLIGQAGYLGTAFAGCLLIYLGQFPRYSRAILMAVGGLIIASSLLFITPSLLNPATFIAGLLSMVWGLAMGGACIYMGKKLKPILANLVLLFLAVQTALNSLTLIWTLIPHGLGLAGGSWTDATIMAQLYFVPAFIWALWWMALSLAMVFFTLKFSYFKIKK